MRRSRQIWIAVVGAVGAAITAPTLPAAAQTGPSGPGGPTSTIPSVAPLQLLPSYGPAGTNFVEVSGGCNQPTGTPIPVTFVGNGGTIAVQAQYSPFNQRWIARLQVPWSTRPGPASVVWGCTSPHQGPITFTVDDPAIARPPAPQDVTVSAGNAFLDVSWFGGTSFGWVVVTSRGGGVRQWQFVPGDVRRASVPATNGEDVQVQVFAVTAFANGIPSDPVTARASATGAAATVAGSPRSTTLSARVGSLTASWAPPAFDGGSTIVGYSVVAVRQGTGAVAAWQNVGADVREASVDGLAAGSYDVHVMAVTARGFGMAATATGNVPTTGAAQATPASPADIALRHVPDGIVVNWMPASDRGSPILAYAVVAYQHGAVVAWQNAGAGARTATLANLRGPQPPTIVQILAYNRHGYGTPLSTYTGG